MRSRFAVVVVVGASLALAAGTAQAARTQGVDAAGDPFTPGTLAFKPSDVTVHVGDFVKWTNTDDVVPHTATEDHGLWDLTGTYGVPGNYGFGPGESRSRKFEAGTQHYYCKVHPTQMRGVVRVPVHTSVRHGAYGSRELTVRWAPRMSNGDRVFDVQIRLDGGPWYRFRKGTHEAKGVRHVSTAPTRHYSLRARMRSKSHPSKATGWSPVVHVSV